MFFLATLIFLNRTNSTFCCTLWKTIYFPFLQNWAKVIISCKLSHKFVLKEEINGGASFSNHRFHKSWFIVNQENTEQRILFICIPWNLVTFPKYILTWFRNQKNWIFFGWYHFRPFQAYWDYTNYPWKGLQLQIIVFTKLTFVR